MKKALSLRDLRKQGLSFEEAAASKAPLGKFRRRSFSSLSEQEKWEVVELLAIQMGIIASGES